MRRLILAGILMTLAVLSANAQSKPNVIYVMADDLGYGDLGVYGQKIIQTPNLDRMAREGMRFTQMYAGSTVCAPSRAVLMTGKHMGHVSVRGNAVRARINDQALRKGERTIAHVFKDAGYATALFGKWGLGEIGSDGHPNKMGFDEFFGVLNQHHAHNFYPSWLIHNSEKYPLRNVAEVEDKERGDGWAREKIDYAPDVIFAKSLEWIEQNKAKPFFLYLASTLPHANNEASSAVGDGQEVPDYGIYKDKPWPNPDKGQAAMITRLDAQVGQLLAKLKALGIEKNTLVIFTSDNGPHEEGKQDIKRFNPSGPLRGTKRALYEGGVRVPFIARWPGKIKAGVTSDHIGYFGDVMATVSELTRQPVKAGLDSISFAPVLMNQPKQQQQHKYVYFEFYEQGGRQSVRFGNWKAIREPMFTGKVQLFDLAKDLGETNNLADANPQIVQQAIAYMNEAHVEDPMWQVRRQTADSSPAEKAYGTMKTRWAKDVSQTLPHPEYPRPQLARENWINLNGWWNYGIGPADGGGPDMWPGKILVPFPIESQLSGVQLRITPQQKLWYGRQFAKPALKAGERLRLNFGAVDWHTIVYVNGKRVGEHKGGYDPFSFDITDALTSDAQQTITLSVWDPTNEQRQPNGKQRLNPGGIFYTPVTGIWQTVWLETVNAAHIERLHIVPNIDDGTVTVSVLHPTNTVARVAVLQEGRTIAEADTQPIHARPVDRANYRATLKISAPRLWSPESPFLYGLKITLTAAGKVTDEVTSYFGMRKISLLKDQWGITRMALNNKPYFQIGPLDQGWWPDGLYTAPTDEALRYDIEMTKKLGMNLARKHVKVEPARWYYWADKLGLLVWQDMPSTTGIVRVHDANDLKFTPEEAAQFKAELKAMMDALGNAPSIIVWVPFNEGWGQHDTNDILKWVKSYDPSRLVDGPSGWLDRGYGDLYDIHRYPGISLFPPQEGRATVLSEFGGLGLLVNDHLWIADRNWGYQQFDTMDKLQARYGELMRELKPAIQAGLSAAIYTQTTDVEIEVNGLMTYDRDVVKFDATQLAKWHAELMQPVTTALLPRTIVPTSEDAPQAWRYTMTEPSSDWMKAEFDDANWQTGNAPFADPSTAQYKPATPWSEGKIWLRRKFNLDDTNIAHLFLRLHNNERVTVFLNGQQVRQEGGHSPGYRWSPLGDKGKQALRKGANVIAVVCEKGQHKTFVDVGLIELKPATTK
jgi:arylsulfatase A-like enzyme